MSDAQRVRGACHAGQVTILGRNKQGFPVVRFSEVAEVNVNVGVGILNQPTNVFVVKGARSPSVVPLNPNWSQK